MNKLILKNISKNYGKTKVLDKINLEISNGIFGLLGPNGAGKTTLMKILTTVLPLEEGSINLENLDWKKENEVRKFIGYLPQHFSIYENMRVIDVLEYIAILKKIHKNLIKKEIEEVLEKTNLLNDKNKKISHLSGGMLRRVGLAQALIGNPKILVIDEPTTGLDPENRIAFRNLLNNLAEDRIIIISTHIVEDIEATCDYLCVLNKGKILFKGSLKEIKSIVKNKIKVAVIEKNEFTNIKNKINLISFKREDNSIILRYIDNGSISLNGHNVEENVEDSYFYLIGDRHDNN